VTTKHAEAELMLGGGTGAGVLVKVESQAGMRLGWEERSFLLGYRLKITCKKAKMVEDS